VSETTAKEIIAIMNRIREELLRRVPESRSVLEQLDRFNELTREPDIGPDDPFYFSSLYDIRIDIDTYLLGPALEAARGDRQAEDLARRVLAWLAWIVETWPQEEWLVDRVESWAEGLVRSGEWQRAAELAPAWLRRRIKDFVRAYGQA
jgi:hypothetical protein